MSAEMKLFWGDPHIHSTASWRCFEFGNEPDSYDGSPADCYRYARDEAQMDFAAVTDHDCGLAQNFDMKPQDWDAIRTAAVDYNDSGRFVAFLGFEWSSNGGHRHVIYSHDNAPMLPCSEYVTPADLWAQLEQHDAQALVIPHHIARHGMPNQWQYHSPKFEPVVEICSIWGCYEFAGNPFECDPNWAPSDARGFAREGLGRGLRFGFIGGGDVHDGRAGGHVLGWDISDLKERWANNRQLKRNPLGCGIAGVYATELTREALLEGFRARRTLAATGLKTAVKMDVDGLFIGAQAQATEQQCRRRVITVEAEANCPLRKIEIVRNGLTLTPYPCSGNSDRVEYVDEQPLTEVVPQISADGEAASVHYYVRVTREDFRMAWTSPVWLEFRL